MRAAVRRWIYYMAGTLDTAASISFACWCCMLLLLLLLLLLLHAAAAAAAAALLSLKILKCPQCSNKYTSMIAAVAIWL